MVTLEERVAVLERRTNVLEETMSGMLPLLRSVHEIVSALSSNVDNLADTINTRLGHSTSLTVFDALEDFGGKLEEFRNKLEQIEGKLS